MTQTESPKLEGRHAAKEGGLTRRCSEHFYKIRPRKDRRGFDLISDALPFGRL